MIILIKSHIRLAIVLTEYARQILPHYCLASCTQPSVIIMHAEVWTQALCRNINQFITAVHLSCEVMLVIF